MKFELKNIKYSEFASHETYCFEASLYIDGKRSYIVSNDGQGGECMVNQISGVTPKYTFKEIREYFASLPKEKHEQGFEYRLCLDTVCSDLVTEHLIVKHLKRDLKRNLVFTEKGEDGLYTVPLKQQGKKWSPEQVLKSLTEEVEHCLNLMSFDDAVKVYRESL